MHHHKPHRNSPLSVIHGFIDRARVDTLLEPWVPDAAERAFVVRCLLEEGPVHHRGANFVLLTLLGEVLEVLGGAPRPALETGEPIHLRLPPHLSELDDDKIFPLLLQTGALDRLSSPGSRAREGMVDCLTDGPPQHALANAAMVNLLTAILARLDEAGR